MKQVNGKMGKWVLGALVALTATGASANGQTAAAYQAAIAKHGDAVTLYNTGQYQDAILVMTALPRSDSAWMAMQPMLIRALATVGRYDDAERVGREAAAMPGGKAVLNTLGETMLLRGKRAAAESLFARAVEQKAPDSLTARLNTAIVAYDRGDRRNALDAFDRFIDIYNTNASSLTSDELVAVGLAVRYLGVRDPQLFKDALKAFDSALRLDPANDAARVKLGELFLEKYNHADAQTEFEEVLRTNPNHPRALVGAAKRADADNQPGADSLVAVALKVNPDYVPALIFRANALAEIEDYAGAQRELAHALRIDPTNSKALGTLAATKFLAKDDAGYASTKQRALALNPRDGDFFVAVAELNARVRQYETAARFAREGITVDSTNWNAFATLANNLLRMGDVAAARRAFESSFKGDPYNLWTKNTLDLLDTYKNYDLVNTAHAQLMVEKTESGILGVYLGDIVEQAYRTFASKYGYAPTAPIRVEVYRSHADFSVRTVGLAGIGALGVSFGNTLAFDSPAAKDAGPFNWASTVWHELAHTFTLGATDHRVPRWLSEGLSVYEEHKARAGWGFTPSAGFLIAFRDRKLVPVSRMNDGFMRPAYPEQVMFSYYQASLVCDLIARDFGEKALVDMLMAYKAGQSTDEVFRSVLRTDLKAFDRKFDDYVRQRFAVPIQSLAGDSIRVEPSMSSEEMLTRALGRRHYPTTMVAAKILMDRGENDLALGLLEAARGLFPENTSADGPYLSLLKIYQARPADSTKMLALLKEMVKYGITEYEPHLMLAGQLQARGDFAGAADALERAMYINPFDAAVHERMADLYARAGDKAKVVRERRALVGLNPVDKAGAWYRLALAQEAAGDARAAIAAVVRSLEDAPNFQLAQELLLKLKGAS
ncbi:MAG: tetratricopeptide repeat protein [Gemmatimonadaceae bacterium]